MKWRWRRFRVQERRMRRWSHHLHCQQGQTLDSRELTLEVDDRNLSVARGAGEDRSEIIWSPSNRVDCRQLEWVSPRSPLAVCRLCSLILSHPSCKSPPLPFPWPCPTSFQMNTRPS